LEGVVCPGTVVGGRAEVPGAVAVGAGTVVVGAGTVGVVWTGGGAAGGCVTMTGAVLDGVVSSSPVSLTNANASSAPAIRTIALIAAVGSCQLGVGARRVRAGAPHSRHHP